MDFSKFEIEIYRRRTFHKIARYDSEEPHQRKRPAYSGVKEALYYKLENLLTETNQKFVDDYQTLGRTTFVYSHLLKKGDLQWLGFNWLKARVGLKLEGVEN